MSYQKAGLLGELLPEVPGKVSKEGEEWATPSRASVVYAQ